MLHWNKCWVLYKIKMFCEPLLCYSLFFFLPTVELLDRLILKRYIYFFFSYIGHVDKAMCDVAVCSSNYSPSVFM